LLAKRSHPKAQPKRNGDLRLFDQDGFRINHHLEFLDRIEPWQCPNVEESRMPQNDFEHWSERVTSWTIQVSEKVRWGPDENGSSGTSSHHTSGTLTRRSKGAFSAKLTVQEYEFSKDNTGPVLHVEAKGSETWELALVTTLGTYELRVGDGSQDVPQTVTAVNINQVHKGTTTIPFALFGNVTGDLPKNPEAASYSLRPGKGSEIRGVANWTLTPTVGASPTPKPTPPNNKPPLPPPPPPTSQGPLTITRLKLEQYSGAYPVRPLALCSVGTHAYYGGITPFPGTIRLHGTPGDVLERVELQFIRGGKTLATGSLSQSASARLLRPFPESGVLSINRQKGIPPVLFQIPSKETEALVTKTDSTVKLQVRARTSQGAEAVCVYGSVPILVQVTDVPRFGVRDPIAGGDNWALPSVAQMLSHYQLEVNDCANMHGGPFAPHKGHRDGRNVDLNFTNYVRFDAECARHLVSLLNDPNYGYKVVQCFVEPPGSRRQFAAFWKVIDESILVDGRPASAVIVNLNPHADHFHWKIDPSRKKPKRRAR
jgi:hypothetical protein